MTWRRGKAGHHARRRLRGVAMVAAGVLTAGAAAVAAAGFDGGGPDEAGASDLPPATAQVTRQTMRDTTDEVGELGWTGLTTVAGRIPGVVTDLPQPGDGIGGARQSTGWTTGRRC